MFICCNCYFIPWNFHSSFLNKDIDTGNPKIYNKFAQVVNADTFYAYSVASVGALLSSNSVHTSSFSSTSQYNFSATMSATYSTQRQQNELNSAQKETLDKYMSLLENLLSESKIENSITNGELMGDHELLKNGINQSENHVDFMVGTPDLNITGTDLYGNEVPLFIDGNFATLKVKEFLENRKEK